MTVGNKIAELIKMKLHSTTFPLPLVTSVLFYIVFTSTLCEMLRRVKKRNRSHLQSVQESANIYCSNRAGRNRTDEKDVEKCSHSESTGSIVAPVKKELFGEKRNRMISATPSGASHTTLRRGVCFMQALFGSSGRTTIIEVRVSDGNTALQRIPCCANS